MGFVSAAGCLDRSHPASSVTDTTPSKAPMPSDHLRRGLASASVLWSEFVKRRNEGEALIDVLPQSTRPAEQAPCVPAPPLRANLSQSELTGQFRYKYCKPHPFVKRRRGL